MNNYFSVQRIVSKISSFNKFLNTKESIIFLFKSSLTCRLERREPSLESKKYSLARSSEVQVQFGTGFFPVSFFFYPHSTRTHVVVRVSTKLFPSFNRFSFKKIDNNIFLQPTEFPHFTSKINLTFESCEMATVKQEISDVVIKTEAKEETIKHESPEVAIKAEPKEEKAVEITDGPSKIKTEGDVTNGNAVTSVDGNTELDNKIIRQVEVRRNLLSCEYELSNSFFSVFQYYFGDFNLPRDKFLKEQIALDDGWIPIATMLKFARLSQLTKSPQVIFSALKKSPSGLMEVNESASKIRRSKSQPIPEETSEYLAGVKSRTIYCKGLPKEGMSIDKLLDFFKGYPTVLNIKVNIPRLSFFAR